jgi:hypothetical protein
MTPMNEMPAVKLLTVLLLTALAPALGCESEHCHEEDEGCGHAGSGVGASSSGGMTGQGGGGESASALALEYCNCMLGDACHDQYHDVFGPNSDEELARENCLATADALPVAGADVDMGNFIECRIHYCELGQTDATACDNTIGGACE